MPLETVKTMQAERALRLALKQRQPVINFGDDDEVSARTFFGTARSSLEARLADVPVREEDRGTAVRAFVLDIVSMQSSPDTPTHAEVSRYMHDNGHSIASRFDAAREVQEPVVKVGGEEVPLSIRDGTVGQSESATHDLAILLLLRFGAFEGIDYSDETRKVIGANLAIDFLFDDAFAENARAKLRRSMANVNHDEHDDHLTSANENLAETRRLEGAERVVRAKTARVRSATRMVVFENVSALVLATTLVVVAWWKGGALLATHRTAAWAASASIFTYIVSRAIWLHLPRH